eukprot:COSAG03_NODE_11495_length_589_cov_1.569388_1_plen_81_part_01
MRDRLNPINDSEPATGADKGDGDSRRCGSCAVLLAVAGVSALVAGGGLLIWESEGGEDYGYCTHTKHSTPNNVSLSLSLSL